MLFSDKLEQIYEENKHNNRVLYVKINDAFREELAKGLYMGENYNLTTHIIRVENAWKLLAQKNNLDKDYFKNLCFQAAPESAKKFWKNK